MKSSIFFLSLLFIALIAAHPSFAQEPVPCDSCATFPAGSYMISGGPELSGAVYELSCQSGTWEDMNAAPSDPCSSCSAAIGTICSDGAVYAGTTVGGARMYVADADESGTFIYGGSGTDLNGNNASVVPELLDDGLANTNWLLASGTGDHNAAQACRNKGSDWYLPASDELGDIFARRAQLGPANLPTSGWYWSSSELDSNSAWIRQFSGGGQFNFSKTYAALVRCVRR